jgi:actin-related protein 2
MEEDESKRVIVIDNGSGYLKAGYSNQSSPEINIPSVIGREILRYDEKIDIEKIKEAKSKTEQKKLIKQMIKEHYLKQIMIGDETIGFSSLLELTHPVTEGVITDEEDLYLLWDYILTKKMGIDDPSEKKIIVTEAPLNPLENKIKIFEILFEKIGVGAINIEPQAKCSLFCEGIDTGMVLDSGDGVTQCIPVSDGAILKHSIERMDIAGRHITEYLVKLLQKKGYFFNSSADFEFVRELKERYCFVSNDIESDRLLERETPYYNSFHLLPDQTRIRISDEKFEATEILFQPNLIGKEYDGISYMIMKSINKSPMDCRTGLYENIVLSGATTLFPGFSTRIENDIKKIYKETILKDVEDKKVKMNINVIDSNKRKFSVFIGASIIANHYNSSDNDDYWITRDEWLDCEDGGEFNKVNLIKNKCQSYLKDKE